jgi:hypothetical protein
MTKRGHHSSGHTNISENVLGPFNLIGQVKRTLVQALRLCTGLTVHKRSRGIALPFHDHGNRRGWGVSVTPWPLFTPIKEPVPILQEAGWAENLAPNWFRSPDHPIRSQSLYGLRNPAQTWLDRSSKYHLLRHHFPPNTVLMCHSKSEERHQIAWR